MSVKASKGNTSEKEVTSAQIYLGVKELVKEKKHQNKQTKKS